MFFPKPALDWTRSDRAHPFCWRLDPPEASWATVCVIVARFVPDAPLWFTVAV
jgi:hypothetical protein